jgi:hypothetical protein
MRRPVAVLVALTAALASCAPAPPARRTGGAGSGGGMAALAPLLGSWCVEGVVVGLDGDESIALGGAEVETTSRGGAQLERLRLRIRGELVESLTVRSWDAERGRYRFGVVRGATGELVVLEGASSGPRWELDTLRFDDAVRTGARSIHTRLVERLTGPDRFRREYYGSADLGGTWAPSGWLDYRRAPERGCAAIEASR